VAELPAITIASETVLKRDVSFMVFLLLSLMPALTGAFRASM
jgi:hypothetical protein